MTSLSRSCLLLASYATGLLAPAFVSAQSRFLGRVGKPIHHNVDPCPTSCAVAGPSPGNWTAYRNFDQLQSCQYTLFYEFSLSMNPSMTPHTAPHLCMHCPWYRLGGPTKVNGERSPGQGCRRRLWIGWSTGGGPKAAAEIRVLSKQMRQYLASGYRAADSASIVFAQWGAVGVYIGKGLQNEGIASAAVRALENSIPSLGQPEGLSDAGTLDMPLCQRDDDSDHIFGCMATSSASFTPIQEAIKSWSNAQCLALDGAKNISGPGFLITPYATKAATEANATRSSTSRFKRLSARGDFRTIQVVSGDSYASLATKCGISGADFMTYNPQSNSCSTLQPLQHVCCSAGTLPDFRPKPNPDGSCATYTVAPGDTCAGLAVANSLTVDDLNKFNSQTWGWIGMPYPLEPFHHLSELGQPAHASAPGWDPMRPLCAGHYGAARRYRPPNPQPVPAQYCCDIWGQGGITAEFCTNTSTGAPGTAKPGTNGCISNCGTAMVKSDPTSVFGSIAYFVGFGLGRPCLYGLR